MAITADAIYEDGCLKLSIPLPLPNQTPVKVLMRSIRDDVIEISTDEPKAMSAEDATTRNMFCDDTISKTDIVAHELRLDELFWKYSSPQMRSVSNLIHKVAAAEAPILICGENGTEKEMVALAIHRRSARKESSFVPVNCGILPETFIEGELFGYDKCGAAKMKANIEVKPGGTLFLEEVGRLSPGLQLKLLKLLREKVIESGRGRIEIDVRVIASSSEELEQAVKDGKFVEDLYYRLAVVQIPLPPLREREADICLVAQFFLQKYATQFGKAGMAFDQDSISALKRYAWPGNIRELENRVNRAVIMADEKRLTPQDLELSSLTATRRTTTLKEARESLEREMIQQGLRSHGGKIAPAAAELGISRPTFYELMEKLGINKEPVSQVSN